MGSTKTQHIQEVMAEALTAGKFETARRLGAAHLAVAVDNDEIRLLMHESLRRLGDISRAGVLLRDSPTLLRTSRTWALLAEDHYLLTVNNSFRTSAEGAAGLTLEEYQQKHEALADQYFAKAEDHAHSADDRDFLAARLRRSGRSDAAAALATQIPRPPAPAPADPPVVVGHGSLGGRLWLDDGSPIINATVTLGLHSEQHYADPATYLKTNMHYKAKRIARPEVLTTAANARGEYRFDRVPAGRCAFLSVTLPTDQHAVHTRFVAQEIEVEADRHRVLNAEVTPWISAEPRPMESTLVADRVWRRSPLRKVYEQSLVNPFYFDFPTQPLWFELPTGVAANAERLWLFNSETPDEPIAFQLHGNTLVFMAELPGLGQLDSGNARSIRQYALYESPAAIAATEVPSADDQHPWLIHAGKDVVELDTGVARFRLPLGRGVGPIAPLQSVMGPDGQWRGEGRWVLPEGVAVELWQSQCVTLGPVFCELHMTFCFSTGQTVAWRVRAYRNEQTLLVRETSVPIAGAAFEFSLAEFNGGRGYLHWMPENGSASWSDLTEQDRELARLQESVPWWIPPSGFAYAMTSDRPESEDYLAVFTMRRGEWIDRHFASISKGPGDDRREWDWPYPEMVGSTVSMITAHSRPDGDQVFRFGCFDGERQWGLMASAFSENDGPRKLLSATQHKYSSPRLQDFKDWQLDEADRHARPSVVATRDQLPTLKTKKEDPRFRPLYERLKNNPYPHGLAGRGLCALLDGDPVELWMIKQEILAEAPIRAKMTLLGRDYGDMYSPVGARPITPWVENYDLVAATGAFRPDEERLCRAFFLLMGHLYQEEDLMNWRFNSRNANFEADRVDVVGAVGLAFRGNPDADAMIDHAAGLMESSLNIYCTPGSGKWYENPACYYLHAASCRLNLAWHLYNHDIFDSTKIPRLKDFLSWGINLLTPAFPTDNELLKNGCDEQTYAATERGRRIPPIGDHANLGQWIGEFYPLLAQAYEDQDPAFAHRLRWAYDRGGRDGGHFNTYALHFVHVREKDLATPEPIVQPSRRLEGFGAVLRDRQNTAGEGYCLFKLGPGGYRYHRTEGSIIFFADGKPLIYDGGEGGETWRHSTLSFGETHMPLAPGHIERFATFDRLDFAQGVNPKALEPGDPVFLSDSCEHHLVEVARQRFNEPHPANSRSCLWVKGDYLLLHDQLDLPGDTTTHWHLQAVADDHEQRGENDWTFRGRYGTDFQVLLPGQHFDQSSISQSPMLENRRRPEDCFSMRHLRVTAASPDQVLALIRPLHGNRETLTAQRRAVGRSGAAVRVQGPGLDDRHLLDRGGTQWDDQGIRFVGRYGSVLRRDGVLTLCLIDGQTLAADALELHSSGVKALLVHDRASGGLTLEAEGHGELEVRGLGEPWRLQLSPADGRVRLSR